MLSQQASQQLQQSQQDNHRLRRTAEFTKFLQDVRTFLPTVKRPVCFISYAWEDSVIASQKKEEDRLHARLARLKEDLEALGAQVFLDIYQMHGNMILQMQNNIIMSDFIF